MIDAFQDDSHPGRSAYDAMEYDTAHREEDNASRGWGGFRSAAICHC